MDELEQPPRLEKKCVAHEVVSPSSSPPPSRPVVVDPREELVVMVPTGELVVVPGEKLVVAPGRELVVDPEYKPVMLLELVVGAGVSSTKGAGVGVESGTWKKMST